MDLSNPGELIVPRVPPTLDVFGSSCKWTDEELQTVHDDGRDLHPLRELDNKA